jgi:hypothetical protein
MLACSVHPRERDKTKGCRAWFLTCSVGDVAMREPALTRHLPSADQVRDQAGDAARETKPWVVRLGRFGRVTNGAVYAIVGLLAAQVAVGAGGATADPRGVLAWLVQAPFGRFLLAAIALGLAGYALWRFVQATLDTEGKGSDAKGLLARGAYLAIGVAYAGLALSALGLSLDRGGGAGGDASARDGTAQLLAQPFGQWLVGIVGMAVLGLALYQFYSAYRGTFLEHLKLAEMSPTQVCWATRLGRLGFATRGVAFGVIGAFLLVAARQARAEEARGLAGALAAVAAQPFGPWLLGAVAVGMLAYGAFLLVEARFGRMVIR